MKNTADRIRPFLTFIVQGSSKKPDRQTQDLGAFLVKITQSTNTEVLFVIAHNDYARVTMYSIMTGYGPTASFEPDQIRRPTTLDIPEPENFAALMAILKANCRRGAEGAKDKPNPRKPRKAVIVITTDAFIKGFLHRYFSPMAGWRETHHLDDRIAYNTAVVIDMNTRDGQNSPGAKHRPWKMSIVRSNEAGK